MRIDQAQVVFPEERDEYVEDLEQSLARAESHLAHLHRQTKELEATARALSAELGGIRGSAAYKLAAKLSRICHGMLPPGSLRRRTLRLGYRGLRAVPKLRNRRWARAKLAALASTAERKAKLIFHACRIEDRRFVGFEQARIRVIPNLPRFSRQRVVDASIIIPVFNHWRDSLACLESIARLTSGLSYEVIVIDDCSSDGTIDLFNRIEGLVVIRNESNLGFIGSCNRGAAAARGEFLVFLNNDTVVTQGWLEALAQTFRTIPGAGYVGAKLIYPDGRLQEAGSVIWSDATGWNYGKFGDPGHPMFNFTREVDYCSGACVMVPRSLFHQLGGFDPLFTPAYYEDTDLAFKIQRAGRKVMYQPHSRIIHHEGLTSGTNLEAGVKSYQVVNQKKFHDRWGPRLNFHAPAPHPDADRNVHTRHYEIADRGGILVIDYRLPFFDQDAGSLRMMEILRALSRTGHHVTFVPGDMTGWSSYLEALQFMGVEVACRPYFLSLADYLKHHGREFGLAILSRFETTSEHLSTVRRLAPKAKVVYDTVDLGFLRHERHARLTHDNALAASVIVRKQRELRLASRADCTLVVSPVEKTILEEECPQLDVRILSTIYPVETFEVPRFEDRHTMLFIGSFQHAPNADAVLYFAHEIFPQIHQRLPKTIFQIIGPDAPPEILALSSPAIHVLGHVPDVKPLFNQARVSVAPLRFGAGVKGKVNQSMALGVPTVATSIAAEGMYLVHEHDAMIADDPADFAEAVVRLFTNRELWQRVSANGRENLRTHFSAEAAARAINELLAWADLAPPRHQKDTRVSPPFAEVPPGRSRPAA